MYFYIETRKNNSVYHNNAVKSTADYTPEEYAALIKGEEIPSEWDEDGNPVEYDFMEEI